MVNTICTYVKVPLCCQLWHVPKRQLQYFVIFLLTLLVLYFVAVLQSKWLTKSSWYNEHLMFFICIFCLKNHAFKILFQNHVLIICYQNHGQNVCHQNHVLIIFCYQYSALHNGYPNKKFLHEKHVFKVEMFWKVMNFFT